MNPIAFGIGLFIGNTLGQRLIAHKSWSESIGVGILSGLIGWLVLITIS
jgi:predicted MFS family arabinose efflux permease